MTGWISIQFSASVKWMEIQICTAQPVTVMQFYQWEAKSLGNVVTALLKLYHKVRTAKAWRNCTFGKAELWLPHLVTDKKTKTGKNFLESLFPVLLFRFWYLHKNEIPCLIISITLSSFVVLVICLYLLVIYLTVAPTNIHQLAHTPVMGKQMFPRACWVIHAHCLIAGLWNLQVMGAKPFP